MEIRISIGPDRKDAFPEYVTNLESFEADAGLPGNQRTLPESAWRRRTGTLAGEARVKWLRPPLAAPAQARVDAMVAGADDARVATLEVRVMAQARVDAMVAGADDARIAPLEVRAIVKHLDSGDRQWPSASVEVDRGQQTSLQKRP